MADRDPVHQQAVGEGSLVPYVKHYKLPLLPFERQLINLAEITEEEYRKFAAEVAARGTLRPAEYDHIPDIQNTGVLESILISLLVGAALTAASYFLTPKPRMPGEQERGRQRQLGSRTGATIFAPTSGFDSLADLATYGDAIPILFGRYTGTTGGMLISPKLVWSRSFSYGNQQAVKQLYIVSEQGTGTAGIDKPDLPGIFLGNVPLDAAYAHTFAFYWRSGTFNGTSRIKADNLRYGTRGSAGSGDPEANGDIFLAPTRDSQADTAFCSTYSPSSNVEFGAFAPMYNGTDYRVNWKVIVIAELEGQADDPENQALLERIKIAGSYGKDVPGNRIFIRQKYQAGTGRAYSRRSGIVSIDNKTATSGDLRVETVLVGSTCTFMIGGGKIKNNYYYRPPAKNVSVDDINNELDSQRSAADAALQLGETIQIGFTLWKVTSRSRAIWQPGQDQYIGLTCIEVFGFGGESRQVGMVSNRVLTEPVTSLGDDEGSQSIVPISFYPLMRTQLATVRNTRPCDTTEIGIKSQVWNRANNLCNFATILSPEELRKAEAKQVQISGGTMTTYFKRTSVFQVQVRPAGLDSNGFEYRWQNLGRSFCITGEQPLDVYNYIRIQHPQRLQYEYRFVPRPGADVIRHMGIEDYLWQLDSRQAASNTSQIAETANVSGYGTFTLYATGKLVNVREVEFNPEMAQGYSETTTTTETQGPASIAVVEYRPQGGSPSTHLIRQAFISEVLGTPANKIVGNTYSATATYTVASGKTVTVQWSATVASNQNSDGSYINANLFGYSRVWFSPSTTVVNFTGTNWTTNDQVTDLRSISGGNPFGGSMPSNICRVGDTNCTQIGPLLQVTGLRTVIVNTPVAGERIFESKSQLADVSFYSSLLTKSNESSPEHSITYVNEIVDNDFTPNYDNMTMAGLALKASRTYAQLDQLRVWKDDGIPVLRFHPDEANTTGPSNLLCDLIYYLLTDKTAGAGSLVNAAQINTADFAVVARFLRTNKLFFDGPITDATNIRSFITSVAPFFLCNFVIRDGLFSLVPAVPTTSSGAISTAAVPISALFTSGNIIEDSFNIEYLNSEERNNIQAVMRYRQGAKNQLPVERTLNVRWNNGTSSADRIESFDLTQYCTSRDHALLAAKYILSVRRRITHSVRFKTTALGLNLAPGSYIRVITEASPYSGVNNGVVSETGAITSATPLANGNYSIVYYRPPAEAVSTGTLTVSGNATSQSALYGSVFSVVTSATTSNTYIVEQLTLDGEGLVEIVASHFPTDASYRSDIAQDLVSTSAFLVEG